MANALRLTMLAALALACTRVCADIDGSNREIFYMTDFLSCGDRCAMFDSSVKYGQRLASDGTVDKLSAAAYRGNVVSKQLRNSAGGINFEFPMDGELRYARFRGGDPTKVYGVSIDSADAAATRSHQFVAYSTSVSLLLRLPSPPTETQDDAYLDPFSFSMRSGDKSVRIKKVEQNWVLHVLSPGGKYQDLVSIPTNEWNNITFVYGGSLDRISVGVYLNGDHRGDYQIRVPVSPTFIDLAVKGVDFDLHSVSIADAPECGGCVQWNNAGLCRRSTSGESKFNWPEYRCVCHDAWGQKCQYQTRRDENGPRLSNKCELSFNAGFAEDAERAAAKCNSTCATCPVTCGDDDKYKEDCDKLGFGKVCTLSLTDAKDVPTSEPVCIPKHCDSDADKKLLLLGRVFTSKTSGGSMCGLTYETDGGSSAKTTVIAAVIGGVVGVVLIAGLVFFLRLRFCKGTKKAAAGPVLSPYRSVE